MSYSKPYKGLWQYYRDELNASITDSELFKFKTRITGRTPTDGNARCWNICTIKIL